LPQASEALIKMVKTYDDPSTSSLISLRSFEYRLEILDFLKSRVADISVKAASHSTISEKSVAKVFVYWGQGANQATPLVQSCIRQMGTVFGAKNLVVLDDSNLGEYLDVPELVTQRTAGYRAHYSDILRAGLLAKHGGIWLDATVWVARDVRDEILKRMEPSGFFSFRYSNSRLASWLLSCEKGNYVVTMLYETLIDYWNENQKLLGYFMFHDVFTCLYFSDPRFKFEVDSMIFEDANEPHILQRELLFTEFDPIRFEDLLEHHPIQKLTHKLGKRELTQSSTYAHIVKIGT
jgi:hypothetical protein